MARYFDNLQFWFAIKECVMELVWVEKGIVMGCAI